MLIKRDLKWIKSVTSYSTNATESNGGHDLQQINSFGTGWISLCSVNETGQLLDKRPSLSVHN